MSLTSSLQRIVSAKADIKTSIEAKGVTVPNNASIVDYPDYIDAITTGGGGGGSSVIVIPVVSNIVLDGSMLSWDAPDLSDYPEFSQFDPDFDYLVVINEGTAIETSFVTSLRNIDVFYYIRGRNDIPFSIYAILKLTNTADTEKTTLNPYSYTQDIGKYLPNGARGMGVGVVGTDIYLFGGNTTGNVNLNTIVKFDTTTETVTTLGTTLPYNMYGMGVGVYGTTIYLLGGWTSSSQNTIRKFDTTTNTLTTINVTMPVAESNVGYATVGTNVYLFGGYTTNTGSRNVIKFDMSTETVSLLTVQCPHNDFDIGVGAAGTDIYLFGGNTQLTLPSYSSRPIYKFDTTTETFTTLDAAVQTSMLRAPGVGVFENDGMFVIGGQYGSSSYTASIYRFGSYTERYIYTTKDTGLNHQSRRGIAVGVVGNNLYYFGGMNASTWYTTIGKITKRVQ